MAMRRPHRSIETFDISLMAVVTKAMGAFLVLMLLLVPSYVGMPELQQATEDANAKNRDLEQQVAALTHAQRQEPAEMAKTLERVAELERDNKRLQAGGGASALIMTISAADCDPDARIELYIHGENVPLRDGSAWPAVRRGPQAVPSEVLHMKEDGGKSHISNWIFGLLGLWISHPPHHEMARRIRERVDYIVLLAINNVTVGSRYGVYVKVTGTLRSPCRVAGMALPMADVHFTASRFGRDVDASNKVYYCGTYIFTERGLEAANWTPEAQAALDRRLGTQ